MMVFGWSSVFFVSGFLLQRRWNKNSASPLCGTWDFPAPAADNPHNPSKQFFQSMDGNVPTPSKVRIYSSRHPTHCHVRLLGCFSIFLRIKSAGLSYVVENYYFLFIIIYWDSFAHEKKEIHENRFARKQFVSPAWWCFFFVLKRP